MTKLLNKHDYYTTTDISLSAALCCYGYRVEALDKQNPSRVSFSIARDEKLDELVQGYFTHQLKVEPLSFFNFLKEIKTRMYHA